MPNHPNRRRAWQTSGSTVLLWDSDGFGREFLREFWVPLKGGYVREIDEDHPGILGAQVCNGLYSFGPTLSASRDTLLSVIRREYRRTSAAGKHTLDAY